MKRLWNTAGEWAADYQAISHMEGNGTRLPLWLLRLWGVWIHLRLELNYQICKRRGHSLVSETNVGPESGSESIECTRCGWYQHITYY